MSTASCGTFFHVATSLWPLYQPNVCDSRGVRNRAPGGMFAGSATQSQAARQASKSAILCDRGGGGAMRSMARSPT